VLLIESQLLYHAVVRHLLLWEKRVRRKDGVEGYDKIGFGLKEIIKKYGFGWLAQYIFNWAANTLRQDLRTSFHFRYGNWRGDIR
jgi:hypothetical protein